MNDDSRPAGTAEENCRQGTKPCPVCIRLITEYRHAGLKIPGCVLCAYGHRLADYPNIHSAPEKLPVWAWTVPLSEGA